MFAAPTPDALYAGVRAVDWREHLSVDGTLAVDAVSQRSAITHTQFAALKVKDAVVDQFRERDGRRPSVDVAAFRMMGLAVVGRLADRYGIRIELQANPEGGTITHLTGRVLGPTGTTREGRQGQHQ